jgi:hypothetical protein
VDQSAALRTAALRLPADDDGAGAQRRATCIGNMVDVDWRYSVELKRLAQLADDTGHVCTPVQVMVTTGSGLWLAHADAYVVP